MFSLIRFLLILVFCFLSVANSLENSAQVATPGKATNTEELTEKLAAYEIKPVKDPYAEWISYDVPEILKTQLPDSKGVVKDIISRKCTLENDEKVFPSEACFKKCSLPSFVISSIALCNFFT